MFNKLFQKVTVQAHSMGSQHGKFNVPTISEKEIGIYYGRNVSLDLHKEKL